MPWIDIQNLVREDEPTEREKQQVIDFARRKAKPRFYADENFPELAIAILRRFKADVLTVRETGRRGYPVSPAIETISTNAVFHLYTVPPWLFSILAEGPPAR